MIFYFTIKINNVRIKSSSELNFLYQRLSEDSSEDNLYQTMHAFLNYLDNKGYYSLLCKKNLMELAKAKKIDNKVDRTIWTKKVAMVFGKILKRINIPINLISYILVTILKLQLMFTDTRTL